MAFTCGFFNSQNGDRKYNAEQMASIFDGLIKDGVYDTVGDIFAVTPGTGMQVLVGSGRAWFDHTWNNNDAQYPLAITAADVSLPRYDAVVLETNHSDTVRTNRLRVLTGTPASNPVKPTMTSTANVKQHPLAYIKVTAGATAITQSMIQVVVGTSECPFVTGIIDTAQIDALFQQWNGEFNEWFENLKAQLSDNVVANLQGQIDQKVAKADVATTADIEAGTSTTKWVTPKGLKESGIDKNDMFNIGDIRLSRLTTLGDNYLLANGAIFSGSDYPKLLEVMSGGNIGYGGGTNTYSERIATKKGQNSLSFLKSDGNVITILSLDKGYLEKISLNTSPYIGTGNSISNAYELIRLNGRYFIYGTYYTSSTNYIYVLTSTDLHSWTKCSLSVSTTFTTDLQMIYYRNAYYLFGTYWQDGYGGFNVCLLKSTNGTSFTTVYSPSKASNVVYVNNASDRLTLIASGSNMGIIQSRYYSSYEYYWNSIFVYILNGDSLATNSNGDFSQHTIQNLQGIRGRLFHGSDATNIYLYAYTSSGNTGYMTTIPKSNFTGGDVAASQGTVSLNGKTFSDFIFPWNDDGFYVFEDLSANGILTWKVYNYKNSTFTPIGSINMASQPNGGANIVANSENLLAPGSLDNMVGSFSNVLPLVSVDGCYSYIKVK